MKNPIKTKILEDFCLKYGRKNQITGEIEKKWFLSDNIELGEMESYISSAFDRYAREMIKAVLPRKATCRPGSTDVYRKMVDTYNLCLSDIQRHAEELLGKE
mgnify:CR=1 FL=1